MIKVLQVFDSLEISGGVQGVIMNVYRKMDKNLVDMQFAAYDAPKVNSYEKEIKSNGGKVFKIKNLGDAGVVGFYNQFIELFKSNKFDVVHAHNIHHNGLILLASKKMGIPIRISHSHQAYDERNDAFFRKIFASTLKLVNVAVATKRVACSDYAAKFLYGKFLSYEFLPNAIDIKKYNIADTKMELRHKYGFLDDKQTILIHIGRFCAPKNQMFLINIMNLIKDNNCILLMIGEGELHRKISVEVSNHNLQKKIMFMGLRDDIPQLLKLSDCMMLPSIHEGLPLVAIEAQAAGCQSLLSNRITRQADLGVGLVEYLDIKNENVWVKKIKNINKNKKVSLDSIHDKMKKNKFDTETNLKEWYKMYGAKI